ncbi:unnamed protein product, partial [Ectocarpus fasciculatus]
PHLCIFFTPWGFEPTTSATGGFEVATCDHRGDRLLRLQRIIPQAIYSTIGCSRRQHTVRPYITLTESTTRTVYLRLPHHTYIVHYCCYAIGSSKHTHCLR